jgi:hypothetical protein
MRTVLFWDNWVVALMDANNGDPKRCSRGIRRTSKPLLMFGLEWRKGGARHRLLGRDVEGRETRPFGSSHGDSGHALTRPVGRGHQ